VEALIARVRVPPLRITHPGNKRAHWMSAGNSRVRESHRARTCEGEAGWPTLFGR
jgi:hypothetical protein